MRAVFTTRDPHARLMVEAYWGEMPPFGLAESVAVWTDRGGEEDDFVLFLPHTRAPPVGLYDMVASGRIGELLVRHLRPAPVVCYHRFDVRLSDYMWPNPYPVLKAVFKGGALLFAEVKDCFGTIADVKCDGCVQAYMPDVLLKPSDNVVVAQVPLTDCGARLGIPRPEGCLA